MQMHRSRRLVPILMAAAFLLVLVSIGLVRATGQLIQQANKYTRQLTPAITQYAFDTATPTTAPLPTLPPVPSLPSLAVQGNQLVNATTGKPVVLLGAAHSSFEYHCPKPGENDHFGPDDFAAMESWGMNTIRITLSSQLWLNTKGTCPGYQKAVNEAVQNAQRAGFYIILSLQWDAPFGDARSPGGSQYPMPDSVTDLRFWEDIANLYRTNTNVLFDLFSEPHDVTAYQWYAGGPITIGAGNDYANTGIPALVHGTYQSIGMRDLVAKIRAISNNVLIVSGTDWGFDLSQLLLPQMTFKDVNVLFATHPWDHGNMQASQWSASFGQAARNHAIIATEFGQYDCQSNFVAQAINYFNASKMSWIAWTWDVGNCQDSSDLLSNWYGMPNSPYSTYIRNQMLQLANSA